MSAEYDARQSVTRTVNAFLSISQDVCSSGYLCLNPEEYIFVDNRLMAAFHVVLRSNAVVVYTLLFEGVYRISLLKKCVADVLLVGKNLFDVAFMPLFMTSAIVVLVCFLASKKK